MLMIKLWFRSQNNRLVSLEQFTTNSLDDVTDDYVLESKSDCILCTWQFYSIYTPDRNPSGYILGWYEIKRVENKANKVKKAKV